MAKFLQAVLKGRLDVCSQVMLQIALTHDYSWKVNVRLFSHYSRHVSRHSDPCAPLSLLLVYFITSRFVFLCLPESLISAFHAFHKTIYKKPREVHKFIVSIN